MAGAFNLNEVIENDPALLPTPSAWLGRRPENSMADPERARSREHAGKRGKRSIELPDALAAEVTMPAGEGKLLPTPVATDAFGSRRSTARTDEWISHPGTSLTDAVWEAQGRTIDTRGELTPAAGGEPKPRRLLPTPTAEDGERGRHGSGSDRLGAGTFADGDVRLLPTPQAADGDGGRQEKGAMGDGGGKRPSGQKATLPLPTAVAMRETISETPFAAAVEPGEQASLFDDGADESAAALLPTPVANPDNPGAGGELRAAIVHGEGRRNETGVDTLGRPNRGRGPDLLPTPNTRDHHAQGAGHNPKAHSTALSTVVEKTDRLLPTPTTQDAANCAGPSQHERNSDPLNVTAAKLLPTPQAADAERVSEQGPRYYAGGGDNPTLLGAARRADIAWGVYEGAVRRWEAVLGREAPRPTDEKGRLDPPFVEWMLGYPFVLTWRPEEMTKDEFIAAAIESGCIRVDPEAGKVYALRGALGKVLDEPREIGTKLQSGYLASSVRIGEERKMLRLHRVVWIAANGVPAPALCVCHRNNVKTDNRIENLYLATSEQNSADAARDGLLPTGDDHVATKIDAETRALIAREYAAGDVFQYQLAEKYGISKSRVQQICAEEGWFDLPDLKRTAKLRALGNSVQVQCAEAVGFWARDLILSGMLG